MIRSGVLASERQDIQRYRHGQLQLLLLELQEVIVQLKEVSQKELYHRKERQLLAW